MPFRFFSLLCLLAITNVSLAQNYHHNVSWLRLNLADTIGQRTKVEVQLQQRSQNAALDKSDPFATKQFKSVGLWLSYTLSKTSRITVSPFAYIESHVMNVQPKDETLPAVKEYRFTARYTNEQTGKLVNYGNRYSLEYRLRDLKNDGHYVPNFRARYMIRLEKPVYNILSRRKPVAFELADEISIQFGRAVHNRPNVFDQNRLSLGANYELFRNVKTGVGYLYANQERSSGNEFDNTNMFWLMVTFENLFSQWKHKPINANIKI